ncbi:hypothetical protein [Kineococcus sp. SYSU DK004]|uniref:hypothetical protein n=1 Tax=Kineococcus sp. SYSU DK004 TaxID=3383125 RepID=UPI003D7E2B0C
MHTTLITVHAAAAVVSLLTAVLLLLPRPLPGRAARALALALAVSTAVMTATLAAAVAVGWAGRPAAANGVFAGLTVLAAAATACAVAAVPVAPRRDAAQVERLSARGGFVLITQCAGLAAVAVLDVAPGWAVAAVSVAVVLVAREVVQRLRRAALAHPVGAAR